jgi:hypothetical protein
MEEKLMNERLFIFTSVVCCTTRECELDLDEWNIYGFF